jgi:hypothetical protein
LQDAHKVVWDDALLSTRTPQKGAPFLAWRAENKQVQKLLKKQRKNVFVKGLVFV